MQPGAVMADKEAFASSVAAGALRTIDMPGHESRRQRPQPGWRQSGPDGGGWILPVAVILANLSVNKPAIGGTTVHAGNAGDDQTGRGGNAHDHEGCRRTGADDFGRGGGGFRKVRHVARLRQWTVSAGRVRPGAGGAQGGTAECEISLLPVDQASRRA